MRKAEDAGNPPRHVEMPRRKRATPTITVIASPVYDLLLSLHIAFNATFYTEPDLDQEWFAQARAACPPELHQTLMFFFAEEERRGWCGAHLYGLLYRAPRPTDVLATLDWLGSLPPQELLPLLMDRSGLGDDWREVAASIITADAEGPHDRDRRARVTAFTKRFPTTEREAVQRFLSAPMQERDRLIDALRQWYYLAFTPVESRITTAISREAERLRTRLTTTNPVDVFTSVIHGIAFEVPAAIEHVVLAPCAMIMPIIFSYSIDDTLTYCYPIEESAHSAAEQEILARREMVRLFDALADDSRLRILRHLTDRQMYLTELSEHLKLTKATTRHHMIRLRAAGLVTLHMRDNLSYYSLQRDTLDEPTRVLLRYLGQKPD